jgi:hypothetical protein
MSRFLKLTKLVINTSKIGTIEKKQNKYYVQLLDGSTLSGFSFFGSGKMATEFYTLEICKDINSIDYEIIDKWVKNLK